MTLLSKNQQTSLKLGTSLKTSFIKQLQLWPTEHKFKGNTSHLTTTQRTKRTPIKIKHSSFTFASEQSDNSINPALKRPVQTTHRRKVKSFDVFWSSYNQCFTKTGTSHKKNKLNIFYYVLKPQMTTPTTCRWNTKIQYQTFPMLVQSTVCNFCLIVTSCKHELSHLLAWAD